MKSPPARSRVTANGVAHHVRIDGDSGPWVAFSNSLGCTLEMWDQQAAALSEHHRVFRYDTRGHGRSESSPGPYTLDLLARDLLALLDANGIDTCTMVGLSMGGMLGQTAALLEPGRFTGLVLADTTSRYGPEVAEFWVNRVNTALTIGLGGIAQTTPTRWFTPGFTKQHPELVERYRKMVLNTDPHGYAGCCAAIPAIDVTDQLANITVPTAVIVGADDPSTTVAHARRIHAAIPQSTLHIIPDAAHLSNVEQPARFTEILVGFLAENPPGKRN
jgi:3-oxoadipate enol-lactonase